MEFRSSLHGLMPSSRVNGVKKPGEHCLCGSKEDYKGDAGAACLGPGLYTRSRVRGCHIRPQQIPVVFVRREVCEVRKVEGTFSAFQSMEVRMLVAEEVKAAFSRPSLSCAQH